MIIGVLMIVYTGFHYVTTEKVVDLGPLQINADKNHLVQWSPVVGILLIVGGIAVVMFNKRQRV
jgi:hypothetical protein